MPAREARERGTFMRCTPIKMYARTRGSRERHTYKIHVSGIHASEMHAL